MGSYYYRPKRCPREKAIEEADLKDMIEKIHFDFPYYGYRRVHEHILQDTGEIINTKRIRRIMNKYELYPVTRRKFKVATTDSNHQKKTYPNLLEEMSLNNINQVWVSDITYIRIATTFVYLAVVMDLYSRKIIGWGISTSLGKGLCLEALTGAISSRRPSKGVIHHSDQGVQYASEEYVKMLAGNGFHISMSRRGNPYDNAYCESLMKTLKAEEIYLKEYDSLTDVLENLPKFIQEVYNKKRLHSGLGYLPPEKFEKKIAAMTSGERPILKI